MKTQSFIILTCEKCLTKVAKIISLELLKKIVYKNESTRFLVVLLLMILWKSERSLFILPIMFNWYIMIEKKNQLNALVYTDNKLALEDTQM